MPKHIRTTVQKRWAKSLLAGPFQDGVEDAFARRGLFTHAYRWIAKLESAGVIEQWVIWSADESLHFDVCSPTEHGCPLFIGGPQWDAFLAEARGLGLVPQPEKA